MEFKETRKFTELIIELLNDDDYKELQEFLIINPKANRRNKKGTGKMNKDMFDDIVGSLKEAVEIAKGTKDASRVFKYKNVDVKKIRENAHLSQSNFANAIGVSIKTVQNWEQGRRKPTGTARALLKVFEEKPKAVIEALHLKHV